MEYDPEQAKSLRRDARTTFEEFTSGASWRELPMKIKLMVLHLWRAERDVAPPSRPDRGAGTDRPSAHKNRAKDRAASLYRDRSSARLAGLAGGVARVALGLALRFEHQLLVGFTDLPGFAFRPRGDLVRRFLRGLTLLLDAARLGTLGGAQFAFCRGGSARRSQLGDGRILGLGTEAVQSSLLGRRGISQTVAESWVSKGLHRTPINRFSYTSKVDGDTTGPLVAELRCW